MKSLNKSTDEYNNKTDLFIDELIERNENISLDTSAKCTANGYSNGCGADNIHW